MRHFIFSALCVAALAPPGARADEIRNQSRDAKFQATYVWQDKSAFSAAYSGKNSLATQREKSYSFTATAFLGTRTWTGGELYFNPEIAQGVPLSNLTGLGGFSNGEIARVSGANPTFYRARLFVRQTWGLGGGSDPVESDVNQLSGTADKRRVVITAGNLSVLDVFDDNAYSHDPRTQFMNWSLMTHGAYDYPADARGYSWGIAAEYFHDEWALRAGRFILPREPNGLKLNPRVFASYGDQIELERSYSIAGRAGKLRVLAFRDVAVMARFRDAIDAAAASGGPPDINAVRNATTAKTGYGINFEQALTTDAGVFARISRADGQTETEAFAEIDRSFSAGTVIKGTPWGRADDTFGAAMVRNALSASRQEYLRKGGISFFIGDGALNYRPETIAETFYNWKLFKGTWLALDLQRIVNPAYNADRGPARVGSLRLHLEY